MEEKFKRAGIIIIGNEILKGHVADSNSSFLCKRFHAIGVKVCRIVTVADELEDIAEEVVRFSEKFDIVITTGGIGPTHDDVTYEAVASSFNERVLENSEMAEVIRSCFPGFRNVKNNPIMKMARIPESSKLIYVWPKAEKKKIWLEERESGFPENTKSFSRIGKPYPVVQVRNIYILPGMMEWLELAFDHLQTALENPAVNFYTMVLFLKCSEVNILKELNDAVSKYESRVIFGSYPFRLSGGGHATKIIMESSTIDDVTSAYQYLKSSLSDELINGELEAKDAELVRDLTLGNRSLSGRVKNSFEVIEAALGKYKPDEIYVSFNGGKDCTVLLHLVWAFTRLSEIKEKLNGVYIKADKVFAEVDEFVAKATERYNLNLTRIFGPMKAALTELQKTTPRIKAIFMGTRRTDPHSNDLQEFQMCDADWPPLMRVNPILEWSYDDIWNFLRILAVPYCSLYDEGYTSLGSPKNTLPNSALRISDAKKNYLPAYRLKDGRLEREGRK